MKIKSLTVFTIFLFFAVSSELMSTREAGSYKVARALGITDANISDYIQSIDVLPGKELQQVCGRQDALACTISEFNDSTDKLEYSKIYISDLEAYTGNKTFRHTIFHEIGHVEYSYHFGAGGSDEEREIYADEYAGRFVHS